MNEKIMQKIKYISWILLAMAVIGLIPLSLEVQMDKRPEYISAYAG